MAKDILKEAIADAKAVREVALANAKAALEEAFTPRLQSMLSAKLSEELNESDEDDKEEVEEGYYEENKEVEENFIGEESNDLDEEIDLEEILNELELEEGDDSEEETVDEAKEDSEETIDEAEGDEEEVDEGYQQRVHTQADDVQNVNYKVTNIQEDKDFDLDALLEEINNLDEGREYNDPHSSDEDIEWFKQNSEGKMNEFDRYGGRKAADTSKSDRMKATLPGGKDAVDSFEDWMAAQNGYTPGEAWQDIAKAKFNENMMETELNDVKAALEVKTTELNEVNLLNSKLLYVNRIFKANTLDDAQKLRVVETLDKAECIKEAKLIYETIKDTFTISKGKKTTPKRSIREGLGMASKAAGTSTAPKKAVLNESNDMVARMQKLANITINQ